MRTHQFSSFPELLLNWMKQTSIKIMPRCQIQSQTALQEQALTWLSSNCKPKPTTKPIKASPFQTPEFNWENQYLIPRHAEDDMHKTKKNTQRQGKSLIDEPNIAWKPHLLEIELWWSWIYLNSEFWGKPRKQKTPQTKRRRKKKMTMYQEKPRKARTDAVKNQASTSLSWQQRTPYSNPILNKQNRLMSLQKSRTCVGVNYVK